MVYIIIIIINKALRL